MPIAIALMLLWVGTLLDMASTYLMVVLHIGGEFKEVNQNYIAANGDFLLANFIVINGIFLLVFSLATILALRNPNKVRKYIRATGYGVHAKDEWASKKDLRKEDFVSRRVVLSVSALVVVGSVGEVRFLWFVNNLTEYYGYPGFLGIFLWAFPAVHDQLALYIISVIALIPLFPITYLLLRLTAR